VTGLLALMLLTDTRRRHVRRWPATWCRWTSRTVTKWDRRLIDEGSSCQGVAGRPGTGPYQLQVRHRRHACRRGHGRGDQLAAGARAYLILERIAPNPMVDSDERMAGHHGWLSVRAHLLERNRPPGWGPVALKKFCRIYLTLR